MAGGRPISGNVPLAGGSASGAVAGSVVPGSVVPGSVTCCRSANLEEDTCQTTHQWKLYTQASQLR